MVTRHRWAKFHHAMAAEECSRCGTTRETIAVVGVRYQRELRTYMRPDGIRFTGQAPACDPAMQQISRPILVAYDAWVARHTALGVACK